MVQYVTRKRETKHARGGLCLDEDEARCARSKGWCWWGGWRGQRLAACALSALCKLASAARKTISTRLAPRTVSHRFTTPVVTCCRYYFTQLVSAMEYCHKNQVAHR